MYFSPSTNGFYDSYINAQIPADAVEISAEQYFSLINGQAAGKHITFANGVPSLAEPAPIDPKIAIQAQINALEAQQLLPRITREFMLSAAQAQAAAAGVDPMMNVGYAKLKQFDELIASLRDQL